MKNLFKCYFVILSVFVLTACGGGSEGGTPTDQADNNSGTIMVASEDGLGDTENLFPTTVGNSWNYEVTFEERTNTVLTRSSTYTSVRNVSSSQTVGQITSITLQESNYKNNGRLREVYLDILPGGINYVGDSEADEIETLITPYLYMLFPFSQGTQYASFLDVIRIIPDADLDSVDEKITINVDVEYPPFENLVTEAGIFNDTRLMKELLTIDYQFSFSGQIITSSAEINTNLMVDVGIVKERDVLNSPDLGIEETTTYTLKGYDVDGVRRGIQPQFKVELPGLKYFQTPAIAFDGNRHFVVFAATESSSQSRDDGLYALFINLDGTHTQPFLIIDPSVFSFVSNVEPALAFDGTNYTLLYHLDSHIYTRRFTTDGVALDTMPGTQITENQYEVYQPSSNIHFNGRNYFITWSSWGSNDFVKAKFLSTTGNAGSEIIISVPPNGSHQWPVSCFNGNNYLVTWIDGREAAKVVPAVHSIYAARIDMSGNVLDTDGIAVAITPSFKGSLRCKYENEVFNIYWGADQAGEYDGDNYLSKRVSNDGVLIDAPATSIGSKVAVTRVNNVQDSSPVYFDQFSNPVMWHGYDRKVAFDYSSHAIALWVVPEGTRLKGFKGLLVYQKH